MITRGRYAAAPLVALAAMLLIALVLDSRYVFEPTWLLPSLNFVFLTIIPAVIAYLAVTAYRATGVPAVLAIGAGMVAIALGCGVVPGLLITQLGPNAGITVHNTGAMVAGFCQVAAIVVGPGVVPPGRRRWRNTALAYGGVSALLATVIVLAFIGATPPFFAVGTGTTAIRGVVLGAAVASFAYAGLTWWQVWQRDHSVAFLRWYAVALGLFALGLAGVLTQNGAGGIVSWVGRLGQFAAGLYFLIAIGIASPWHWLSGGGASRLGASRLGASLNQSVLLYRPMIEMMGEVLITLNRRGETMYWNPAAHRLFGRESAGVFGQRLGDLVAPAGMSDVIQDRVIRLLETAEPGRGRRMEAVLREADGRLFPAELVVHGDVTGSDVLVCVLRDITERREAEDKIRRLNDELERRVVERTERLEAANGELETFSYSVSHDLRAPLRSISGFATLLTQHLGAGLDDLGRHYLDTIVSSSQHMGLLIEELLEYSRLGRGQVRAEPVPLEPIVERLEVTFADRVAAAGGRLEVLQPLAVPCADPLLLEQVLVNLLDNAVTYRRPDVTPRVTVAAERRAARVVITVADNGIGIPPEHREKVFEVFARLHRDDEYEGTGIGLATVRKAARLMGTDVTIDSTVGVGTTFTLDLPVAADGRGT